MTIGAAVWTSGGLDDLLTRADAALYAGKAAGRNNVQISTAEPTATLFTPDTRISVSTVQ